MSYNTSDINKLKQQINQYYSFIKNDGMILTNFAKYLLSKADMNLENAVINLKEMSIKDIQNKLYDLTLELNTGNEISDIIKNKIDEENKKLNDKILERNKIYTEIDELTKIQKEIQDELNIMEISKKDYIEKIDIEIKNKEISNLEIINKLQLDINILENKKTELNNDLSLLNNTIDGIYRNEIYDNEYTLPESKYIKKEPMIHLDVDKILDDLNNESCDITYISNREIIREGNDIKNYYNKKLIKINFPINIQLQTDEKIIKIYFICGNEDNNYRKNIYLQQNNNRCFCKNVIKSKKHGKIMENQKENKCTKECLNDKYYECYYNINNGIYKYMYKIIYITNYGRLVPTNYIEFYQDPQQTGHNINPNIQYISNSFEIIENKEYYNCNLCSIPVPQNNYPTYCLGININKNKINLIEQPKLNYRIPRLFIDVIDAFHTQNTDLMQECCKKYLDITRESKIKDSILKDLELNNKLKEKDDIIKLKDIELEDKNKIIISQQEEINKLKEELMKFKKSLSNLIGE